MDWILCGVNVADVVKGINGFRAVPGRGQVGPHVIGKFRDDTVTAVKDTLIDPNTFVVGYKGYQAGDSSIILADWIPLYVSPPLHQPSQEVQQGLFSAYELVINNANYIVKGRISGYGTSGQ